MSSDSSMGRAAPFNPSLPRLVGSFSGSKSAGFAVREVGKVETSSSALGVTVGVFVAV